VSTPLYLDHAATTPPLPAALAAQAEVAAACFGNPSSLHELGRAAHRRLDDAREFLRGTLGAGRLVFTSGGTEADLLGVLGAAIGRPPGRILAGAADHAAVLAQEPALARTRHRLMRVPVGPGGLPSAEQWFDLLGPDVRVVSILHGHNELGSLADVAEIASLVRRVAPQAHLHVDLVQSYGKIPFAIDDLDVDSVAVSGHKLHAPRGIGFLALRSDARVEPLQAGGGQEGGMRGGTENVAGAVALATAAEWMFSHLHDHAAEMRRHCARLEAALASAGAIRLGGEPCLPHVLSLRIPGLVAETLQQECAARGLAFSTGAACHSGQDAPNHVHEAIGLPRRQSREVFRLSVGATTTGDEVERAAGILADAVAHLQSLAPRRAPRAP
jgi:cysteine desulfurase